MLGISASTIPQSFLWDSVDVSIELSDESKESKEEKLGKDKVKILSSDHFQTFSNLSPSKNFQKQCLCLPKEVAGSPPTPPPEVV